VVATPAEAGITSSASITRASFLGLHISSYTARHFHKECRVSFLLWRRAPDLLTQAQQQFSGMSRDPLSFR
jgi:hypothetical protein